MLKTKTEITKWIHAHTNWRSKSFYHINDDLSIDINGAVWLKYIPQWPLGSLGPWTIQFGEISGVFDCSGMKLDSFKGCPTRVTGDFICHNNNISSFEHAPRHVDGDFICGMNKFTNLKNIHKHVRFIGGGLLTGNNLIESHILGIFFIDGIAEFNNFNQPLTKIVNKHLKGDRDVHACQEELIKAGFSEFAKL